MIAMDLITPTGDRHESLSLTYKYMMAQTLLHKGANINWFIVDDGQTDACSRVVAKHPLVMDIGKGRLQVYHVRLIHSPATVGPRSLAHNVMAVIGHVTAGKIAIIEDDDCYPTTYLEEQWVRLEDADMSGTIFQRYYHLPSRSYRIFRNRGSAFCSTAFTRNMIPLLQQVLLDCFNRNSKGIDAKFWEEGKKAGAVQDIYEPEPHELQVIGMKGLPGRAGIGVGHRPKKFQADQQMLVLRGWVGEDYFPAYRDMLV
jgi:hypothetical protein